MGGSNASEGNRVLTVNLLNITSYGRTGTERGGVIRRSIVGTRIGGLPRENEEYANTTDAPA